MLFKDVINLISITHSENSMGDIISTPVEKEVFANKKSIRQSEFYQAQASGLKPELMFEIREIDYNDEQKLKYNDKDYNIIRTHSKNGEIIELICNRLVNKG